MSRSSNASDLSGRSVLVTGGSRGIGRAIAGRFAASGARVLACSRREPPSPVPGVDFVSGDVRDPDVAASLVAEAVSRFGHLDVVVNNAGGGPSVPAADASPNLVTSIVRLNLLAPFFIAQAANAVMQKQDSGGLIINIGSVAAHDPTPGTSVYAAAKAGLSVLTHALALEWAPLVRVNEVMAGLVRTDENEHHYGTEETLAAVAATVPLKRMAVPDDIADACLLLCSPLASYMTGTTLRIDGGGQLPAFTTITHP